MKIRLRYENTFQTLDVDLEEMWVMLSLNCEEGTPEKQREAMVQEAVDKEFNRPEYNNLHKFKRHRKDCAKPGRLDGKVSVIATAETVGSPGTEFIDLFPDEDWERPFSVSLDYEETSRCVHEKLPSRQADLLLRVHVDGYRLTEIAAEEGVTRSAVCHRLQTAEKNFKKIFPKPSTFNPSQG